MPGADVVVIGAGLSGLTAAVALADAGATVEVIAAGHAATHWTAGGIDVAAPPGATTATEGLAALAATVGHPYEHLASGVADGVAFVRRVVAEAGLEYAGLLDDPLRAVPTAIGGTRRASILPSGQAPAMEPWAAEERLLVVGLAGFKDFWPEAIAAALDRPSAWHRQADRPARVDPVVVEWPDVRGRRNFNGLVLARLFDDAAWRRSALSVVAREVEGVRGRVRVALPAVLGLEAHAEALAAAAELVPAPVFEVPLVPPSIPGLRLFGALRAALRRRGGRIVVGEPVVRVEADERRVLAVVASAAARERRVPAGALVLATGGVPGGGLVGRPDGSVVEPLLDLPVAAPPAGTLLAADPVDPAGHPVERAGIRIDGELRPVDAAGRPVLDNVAVVGGMLAGQRYLAERCGDGVAIAGGWLAARRFGRPPVATGRAETAMAKGARK